MALAEPTPELDHGSDGTPESHRDRPRAEDRLRDHAALLDRSPDAILSVDLKGRIRSWSRGAEAIYGWTSEEAVGQNLRTFLPPQNGVDPRAALAVTCDKGEWTGELRQVAQRGKRLTVESRWSLVRGDDGAPLSILVINRDITERRDLEQKFLRAQRLESIGILTGGIAHDLNNVLSPVLMSADLLQKVVDDERGRRIVSSLEASARRGMQMVRQLLWFSRGLESEHRPLQLKHLLTDLARVLRDTLPKAIEVHAEYPASLYPVRGDATQLYQVLMNLAVNAADAMPDGGRLRITAENTLLDDSYARMRPDTEPGRFVRVTVSDTGVGIPEELQEQVFEPFFTTKTSGEGQRGTGLGLSTARSIVRSHGGFLELRSHPGEGATFVLHFPATAVEDDQLDSEGGSGSEGVPRGSGQRILVIDDEPAIRDVLREALENQGYRPLLAGDGAEAVALVADRRGEIAAVIADLAMPVMDGPAAIRAIRRLAPTVPILAMSGLTERGVLDKVGDAVQDYLEKPFTADKLLRTLHRLLTAASPGAGTDARGGLICAKRP